MTEVRDFSVILFLVLVAICAYLVTVRTIGGVAFAGCILASAVAVLLIRNVDNLERFAFRRGNDELLVEMKQVQKDIYAKVDELKQTAEGVARFTVASIISANRFADLDHQEVMLRRRDELEKFLEDAGIPETRRQEIVRPITLMADWDLRTAIVINGVSSWKVPPGTLPTDVTGRDELRKELERFLQQPDRLSGLAQAEKLLNTQQVKSLSLTQSIDQYRAFLESGRLPRTGPADDLRKSPAHSP